MRDALGRPGRQAERLAPVAHVAAHAEPAQLRELGGPGIGVDARLVALELEHPLAASTPQHVRGPLERGVGRSSGSALDDAPAEGERPLGRGVRRAGHHAPRDSRALLTHPAGCPTTGAAACARSASAARS